MAIPLRASFVSSLGLASRIGFVSCGCAAANMQLQGSMHAANDYRIIIDSLALVHSPFPLLLRLGMRTFPSCSRVSK